MTERFVPSIRSFFIAPANRPDLLAKFDRLRKPRGARAPAIDWAITMGERIAENAPLTVRAARELVYLCTEMGRSAAQRAATRLFEPVYLGKDAKEGPRFSARSASRSGRVGNPP